MKLALAVLFCVGCSAATAEEGYSVTLNPKDPQVEDAARDWAERWAAATGIRIDFGERGLPMMLSPGLEDSNGICEGTYRIENALKPYKVLIDPNTDDRCSPWQIGLGHEFGHILGGPHAQHTATGIFHQDDSGGWTDRINADVLTSVCASGNCNWFCPESD